MGHLMVLMSLKLCNSNCFVSRCTQKIDLLFEDCWRDAKYSSRKAIWKVGWMEGPLHSRILRLALFVFVCWLLIMAKFDCCMRCSGRQTSRPLQLPTWKHTLARPMSLSKQRLGDDLGAFVPVWSSIHHNSCRITRFLLRFCVSIQGHSWRFTLFILVWSVNKSANIRFPPMLHQHLRWPMWISACRVAWEATESSRFLQLIRTPRWQCWEPSNAHTIGGLGVGRSV